MRIAITGGTGFVGRHLAKELNVGVKESTDPSSDARGVSSSAQHRPTSEMASWIPLTILATAVSIFRSRLAPWQFMWALSLAIFFGCKWETWFRARSTGVRASAARSLGYLLLWPGMDASTFLASSKPVARPQAKNWLAATAITTLGCGLVRFAAREASGGGGLVAGWIGMIGLILALHFGAFHLLALAWQSVGVAAQPLMTSPLRATSLSEFWGKRWNLGFRQLTHGLVFQPVRKRFGIPAATIAAFFLSGLVHDLVISFPAGGGYGLPTAYFVLQGFGVLVERSKIAARLGIGRGFRGWLFTLFCAGGPVFWLFHPPFVKNVMLPFFAWIGRL